MVFHSENLQCPEVSENGVVDELSCLWVQFQGDNSEEHVLKTMFRLKGVMWHVLGPSVTL
jgi:hypothetical protein